MQKTEIDEIKSLAEKKHNGNLEMAIGEFLDASVEFRAAGGVPVGFEAAVGGIKWEIEHAVNADTPARPKTTGETQAKSKE